MKSFISILFGLFAMSEASFNKGYTANYIPEPANISVGDSPDSWDWREHNIVGDIKDQGSCGSCWAFSAIGALESQITKVTGESIILSEQEAVDCVKNIRSPDNSSVCCYGCNGGEMYSVYQYLINYNLSEDTEEEYPYEGIDQECVPVKSSDNTKLSRFVSLPANETIIKNALYHHGPISIGVNANDDWQEYNGGIYNPTEEECDSSIDHGVILVGYGSEKGLDYWIIRNSWGKDWGEHGYIRLVRGKNACGVATTAIFPVLR